jgi:hypothetical protein
MNFTFKIEYGKTDLIKSRFFTREFKIRSWSDILLKKTCGKSCSQN